MSEIGQRLGAFAANLRTQFVDWIVALNWSEVALAVLVVAVVVPLRGRMAQLAVRIIAGIGNSIGVPVADTIRTVIEPAARTTVVSIALLVALELLDLPAGLSSVLERILVSVILVAIFAGAYVLSAPLAKFLEPYRTASTQIQVDWLLGLAKVAIVMLGVTAVLSIWGIDLGPVLTGMGVLGAGVALAAQDLFRNLIAGMTNMSEKRFAAGDWIRVDGVIEGVVEAAEFRSTQIRRFDKALVHVPNGDLANGSLINFSRMPHRRIYWLVNLTYSTTTRQLGEIKKSIEKYLDDSGDFVPGDEAARYVRIDSFNDSSIDMLVYCFTRSPAYADYLEAKERLVVAIRAAVESCGGAFAFPSRSVYVEAANARPDEAVSGAAAFPPQRSRSTWGG